MIALFSQAAVCPDQMQTRLRAPNADGLESAHRAHTQANSVLQNGFLKVCDFPGPRPTARFPRGVRGARVLFWGVRIPTFPQV